MNKKIKILGASILQLPAIKKASEMGMDVIVVDMNPHAIGFGVCGVKKEVISTIDTSKVLQAARRHKIDGIMTLATDMPMRTVATVAQELKLVGISLDTAIKATDKSEMRKALQENQVPIPSYYKVSNLTDYYDAISHFDAPFMVKPSDSSGSRGIVKVEDISNQKNISDAYDYCVRFSKSGTLVVEEYMSGPEVSVETLTLNGVCNVIQITDKLTTGAPHYVEMGHSQPTSLNADMVAEVCEVAIAANKAVGIENGPSHTEIIVTPEGPKIVEIGARLGGDNINTHLVPLSTGVDIVKCCIQLSIGEVPDIRTKFNRGSAIRYFNQHAGIVRSIEGIDVAQRISGIKQVSIVHGVGETISEINDSGSRMGFVIAQANNALEAVKICEAALEKITIVID